MSSEVLLHRAQVARALGVYHYKVMGEMLLYGKRPSVVDGRYYFTRDDVAEVFERRRLDELEKACRVIRAYQV